MNRFYFFNQYFYLSYSLSLFYLIYYYYYLILTFYNSKIIIINKQKIYIFLQQSNYIDEKKKPKNAYTLNLYTDDYQTMSRKILCGRFAEKLTNNFAVGDQDNNLLLYSTINSKPITVLNSQTSNVSSLTALSFIRTDDQIVVGSNRGSMNVWDLNSLKISYCLKGHTIQICCIVPDSQNENIIASGSYDTNAKLWDLRTRNCQFIMKNHSMRVSAIKISSDSRILMTAGQDGLLQSWDIRMFRNIFQYEVGSPILGIDINNQGLVSIGCMNRTANIYEINAPFNFLGSTKNQTMPVINCIFYKQTFLFTTGTDHLKLWDISENGIIMTDNIQTNAKGIIHTIINDRIQQISFSSGVLSYHQCLLTDVNFMGCCINQSITYLKKEDYFQESNDNQIRKGITLNPNRSIISKLTNNNHIKMINRRSDSIARELKDVNGNINDALSNIHKVSQQMNIIKNQNIEMKNLMQQHNKFMKVIGSRARSIQSLLNLWSKGNIKVVIQHLKNVDIYVVSDVLLHIMQPNKYQISSEFALVIAERAKQMIKSKHLTLIKSGLQFMLQIVLLFKDQMIKLKVFGSDKGVDLAREERLRRFDLLIEQYVQLYQSHRLKRLIDKKDTTSKMAEKLSIELGIIFRKVYGNQSDFI